MDLSDTGRSDPNEHADLPDFNWLHPDLAVGARVPPEAVAVLARRCAFRRLVDLRAEEKHDTALLRRHRIELLHLPTPDMRPVSLAMLWTGVRWVGEGLSRGERVLIHCRYGIGRSILLAACVLVSQGHTACAALEIIKKARAVASPSPDQLRALLCWSVEWYDESQAPCPELTWDDLARIAYRSSPWEADQDSVS
jgi:hypothetical protein